MISTKFEQCPCVGCLCISICRNRGWDDTINSCSLITDFLIWDTKRWDSDLSIHLHRARVKRFHRALKPNRWFIHIRNEDGFKIRTIPEGDDINAPEYKSI